MNSDEMTLTKKQPRLSGTPPEEGKNKQNNFYQNY